RPIRHKSTFVSNSARPIRHRSTFVSNSTRPIRHRSTFVSNSTRPIRHRSTELEFWSFWGGGPRRETIESIIEDFNNSQDNIEVTHVYQPWGDIWTKALAAVASGNDIPDI